MEDDAAKLEGDDRRGFLRATTNTAMAGGLVAGYGTFAGIAGRFLFPAGDVKKSWQFVASVDRLNLGESLPYESPSGEKIVIARHGEGDTADEFIALSSVCPHLGCQVHWEAVNTRFFCPCHNGAFDPQGVATSGPPAKANQRLTQYPLKVEAGLLYIEVAMQSLSRGSEEA